MPTHLEVRETFGYTLSLVLSYAHTHLCTSRFQFDLIRDGAECFTADTGFNVSHGALQYGQAPFLINLSHC